MYNSPHTVYHTMQYGVHAMGIYMMRRILFDVHSSTYVNIRGTHATWYIIVRGTEYVELSRSDVQYTYASYND